MSLKQIRVSLIDFWPSKGDKDVAHAAWASTFDAEKLDAKTDAEISRVVRQVVENVHDTPKEGVILKYFVSAPIFVERQYDKYRMTVQAQDFRIEWFEAKMGRDHITQNELSGRYRTIPDRPFHMPDDVRKICAEAVTVSSASGNIADAYEQLLEQEHAVYQNALNSFPKEWRHRDHPRNRDYKRARDVLRGLLGMSFLTDWRMVMNLNAFEHIMNQRLASDTQMESRVVAFLMMHEVLTAEVCPEAIHKMVERNGWEKLMLEIDETIRNDAD